MAQKAQSKIYNTLVRGARGSGSRPRSIVQVVAEALAQRIEDGEFSAGDRLPTTKELSKEHDVSIVTMSRSIRQLKERGLITARARAGIFVAAPERRHQLSVLKVTIFMVRRPLDFVARGSLAEVYLSQLNDEVLVGVQEQAAASLLQITAVPFAVQLWEDPDRAANFVAAHADGADALIFAGDVYFNADLLASATDLPCLFISDVCRIEGINRLTCDTHAPARLVMQHLVERGYARIAALGGNDTASYADREAAWREVLSEHDLHADEALLMKSSENIDDIEAEIRHLLSLPESRRPDAVFCFNDLRAMVLLRMVREAGLVPGRDIGIAGFDGAPNAIKQGITTAVLPFRQLGLQAASMIRGIVDGSAVQPIAGVLAGGLHQGQTT